MNHYPTHLLIQTNSSMIYIYLAGIKTEVKLWPNGIWNPQLIDRNLMSLEILNKPGFDPTKLPTSEKIDLIRESGGLLIDLLEEKELKCELQLQFCELLTHLPKNLKIIKGHCYLHHCASLTHLPDNLFVMGNLDLEDCSSLANLPKNLKVAGWLDLRGCSSLTKLPDNLEVDEWLNLSDCIPTTEIPKTAKIKGEIYAK